MGLGTERPALFTWQRLWQLTARKASRHSPISVMTFADFADDTSIPADVEEKLLRFARAGLAVASMKGKSYLSLGGAFRWVSPVHR